MNQVTLFQEIKEESQTSVDGNTAASTVQGPSLGAHVIAISSGKGGVGKTNISINLAIAMAQKGKKVCIFDADTSLANVNILLNIAPKFTLEHLLEGSRTLEEVLTEAPGGISIIPAASGIAEFSNLNAEQQKTIVQALMKLEQQFDYLIIDTAAGIGESVLGFLMAVEHCIIVVTPEATSLTDAFSLIKVLRKRGYQNKIHVLTNMVDDYLNSVDLYKRLSGACNKFLKIKLNYFGYVPRDDFLRQSVRKQSPVMLSFPDSRASHRFFTLAESLRELYKGKDVDHSFSTYLKKLFMKEKKQAVVKQNNSIVQAGGYPGSKIHRKIHAKPSKAKVIKLQKGLVQLIRGRSLSNKNMTSLLASVLVQVEKYYPDIGFDSFNLNKVTAPQKRTNKGRSNTGMGNNTARNRPLSSSRDKILLDVD